MVKIKVVAIEFAPDKYQIGEAQVNSFLASGWVMQKEFSRESGVVCLMSKWEKKTKEHNK